MMRKMKALMSGVLCAFAIECVHAIDNAGWLEKARECIQSGSTLDSDETKEDGVYCLVCAVIDGTDGKSADARVGEAVLEAKSKLTAYVHGETVTASRTLERQTTGVSEDGAKTTKSSATFRKRIETKVDAFVRGLKMVGQVTVAEKSYVVCVTCERFEDDSNILKAAQAEYGDEGVVKSIGEASTSELARQKAVRGAVEQVLGTVVVGYDKMGSGSSFQNKVFSGTDGVVEKYRILSECDVAIGKRIEIVAKVSKKSLLDNYSAYMKFLGNPAFYVESNSPDLASHFTEFFTDMGIRVVANPDEAAYVIFCSGNFRDVKHPLEDDCNGVQLSLRFKVQEINGKDVLIDMKNNPKKSVCFVGSDVERQREICADKAFRQMRKPLHEKIQAMVGRLVGQRMSEVASNQDAE